MDLDVVTSHLEDFEVVLRFFYQVSDGKVHSLPVPVQHKRESRKSQVLQQQHRHTAVLSVLRSAAAEQTGVDVLLCILVKGVLHLCCLS